MVCDILIFQLYFFTRSQVMTATMSQIHRLYISATAYKNFITQKSSAYGKLACYGTPKNRPMWLAGERRLALWLDVEHASFTPSKSTAVARAGRCPLNI